jgi:CheY-like chemotaxis protein
VRRSLGCLLRTYGHEPVECEGGREALERYAAEREAIDVAIVDLTMPGMSGRDLVQRLRAENPALPIVVSSGFSVGADLDAVRAEPGVRVMRKPYTADELATTLLAAVEPGDGRPQRAGTRRSA